MLTLVFGGSLFLVFFAYFGYPLTLLLIARVRRREVKKTPFFPSVTLIITVYNEEKRILEKLENTLDLEYPREKLQILVASDGSTDATNGIVEAYAERGGASACDHPGRKGERPERGGSGGAVGNSGLLRCGCPARP